MLHKALGASKRQLMPARIRGGPVMSSASKIDFRNEEIDFPRKLCDGMMFG